MKQNMGLPLNRVPDLLMDERNSLNAGEIRDALSDIDGYFDGNGGMNFSCVGIAARNTIGHALLILYFLEKQINFFIIPTHTRSDAALPPFCDRVVIVGQNAGGGYNLPGLLEWQDNPAYIKGKERMRAGSGAMIVMSSGSTGQPRFVKFHSDKLWANAAACAERLRMNSRSRVLIPVPIAHMFGLGAGFLPAWITGANICLIEKSNVVKLQDKTAGFRPDITLMTPTLCKMFLLVNKRHLSSGMYVTAGERIKKQLYNDFESTCGLLLNLYGSTEMGAIATTRIDDPLEQRVSGAVQPLDNVEIDIVGGEEGDISKGEILCRHPARFDCYIDEYGNERADRGGETSWYPTRDLGSWRDKGRLLVLGRMDNCINRSGFLVSLQEIESRLEDLFSGIDQAIVIEGGPETIRCAGLIAVCELKKGQELAVEKVRELCRDAMPGHWIPDHFYFVAELPRLVNGKADRALVAKQYSTIIRK